MPKSEECDMFKPNFVHMSHYRDANKGSTAASMCKMGASKCGDCSMFKPNLFPALRPE
jgi:hypothetical protein